MRNKVFICAVLLILFHLFLLIHLQFTVWPEMLLIPYLMRRGFELYRDMIVPWTPGLMWILDGWFSLMGLSPERLKLFTWILIVLTDLLIYKIALKRYGLRSSFFALIAYILLQPIYDGNGLWFDLAVVPLLLLAFYKQNPVFLGPAFLIKQSVVWIFPLVASRKDQILLKVKNLILGLVAVVVLSLLWFWSRGTLQDYWWWAYDFTFGVFPTMPGHADLATWRHWAFALFPIAILFSLKTLKLQKLNWILDPRDPAAWSLFLLPFALPRFGLFHFQPALAFLVLSLGQHVTNFMKQERRRKYALLHTTCYILLLTYSLFSISHLISRSWHRPDRFLEPDVYQFAARVALETNPDEPVLLVNGPELAYVLANRLPPKPWFTQFPWFLELPGFQERIIESFKQQELRQVIFTPYLNEGEFAPGSYQPKKLLEYVSRLSNDSND